MDHPGRTLLRSLKETAGPRSMLGLPVGYPVAAVLRPVATRRAHLDPTDVRVLTAWRNRFVHAFLTEFTANEPRTSAWLTETVGPDDTRILFMLDDARSGSTIGYMGLAFIDWEHGRAEADAIVRGEDAPRGLMAQAMRTLLAWARQQLGLHALGVRVRSDNSALEFYRKFGFQEVRRVALRRVDHAGEIRWVEDLGATAGEPSLVHMILPEGRVAIGEERVEVSR